MVHSSMKNLQYDRRLQGRRGWEDPASFEKHLDELPDVADKGEAVGQEGEAAEPQSASPEASDAAPGSGYTPSES